MNTDNVIRLARTHLGGDMESSARLCLEDAIRIVDECGDMILAKHRALKSLAYSIGTSHPDYKAASSTPAARHSRHVINGYNVEFLGAQPAKCGQDY